MDDLLDLNWSGSSATNTKQPSSTPSQSKPKDAFANLLSASKEPSLDGSKLSLNDQLKLQQQPFNNSNTSPLRSISNTTPSSYGSPLRTQVNRSTTANATIPLKNSEFEKKSTAKSSASSSFDSLLDPFGNSSSNRKQESDRNTPLNMLRSQTPSAPLSSNNSSHAWDFDFLDTKISNTKSSFTASSSNTISTATSVSDPFDIDFLSQSATLAAHPIAERSEADENPLGVLAGPAVQKPNKGEYTNQNNEPFAEEDVMSTSQSGRNNTESFSVEDDGLSETIAANNRMINGNILTEEEEDSMLAQLIDMGFSLQQSKFAIEATAGQGVQAALDLLVQSSEKVERTQSSWSRNSTPKRQKESSGNEQARRALFGDDDASSARSSSVASPSSRQAQRELSRSEEQGSQNQKQKPISDNSDLHAQTEKIVSQAHELGGFLYKNAASYLKAGKQKVTKAVGDWQEQQRAHRLQQMQAEQNGPVRPKWMKGSGNDDLEALSKDSSQNIGRFVDDDDDQEGGFEETSAAERNKEAERQSVQEMKRKEEARRRDQAAAAHRLRQEQKARKESLIDDGDQIYVSPSRRGGAASNGRSTPQTSSKTPVKESLLGQPQTQQRPSPAISTPKPSERTRPVINAPANVMGKVNEARILGNEKFKLGQFAEAEAAYTRAIELLPDGHDHLVVLCNNRAMTQLKNGSYKKCLEDCDKAYQLAKKSGDGNTTSEGLVIQWRDQIIKSLYRKAEALEHLEKYKDALTTFEELIKYEGTANTKVNQGMSRCRQALSPRKKTAPAKPSTSSTTTATNNTQNNTPNNNIMSMFDPTSSSAATTPTTPTVSAEELNKSKAVAAMRAKAAAQEAEDAEKLEKVDDVNARLLAWKAGKEQNLRALLATLDTLLWADAQWKGTQMSELINPKKCKITYMKAISKVHPDKLPSNVTVEQRMLASGIFSTLNEAWDSFKAQNNL